MKKQIMRHKKKISSQLNTTHEQVNNTFMEGTIDHNVRNDNQIRKQNKKDEHR